MMKEGIKTLIEEPRKFGYRQAGRFYVLSKMYEVNCPLLMADVPLVGRPGRWRWINLKKALKLRCPKGCSKSHKGRPMSTFPLCRWKQSVRIGLLWLSSKQYHDIDVVFETIGMGFCSRIEHVPKGVEPGKSLGLVLLRAPEHKKKSSRIIMVFQVERIEAVVSPDADDKKIARLVKRGIVPVVVKPDKEQLSLFSLEEQK